MINDYVWYVLSSSATTAALIAIVAFLFKTNITERLKRSIKHEYEIKLKQMDDDLKRKTEIELTRLNSKLSMELEITKLKLGPYSERQFVIYNELWSSLCDLRWAMLKLWSEPSQSNLSNFSSQLFDAHIKLEKSAIIIEERHYIDLMDLLNIFVEYEMGKQTLIEYRNSRSDLPSSEEIQLMVNENRDTKNLLLAFFPDIRNSLRRQIGSVRDEA